MKNTNTRSFKSLAMARIVRNSLNKSQNGKVWAIYQEVRTFTVPFRGVTTSVTYFVKEK